MNMTKLTAGFLAAAMMLTGTASFTETDSLTASAEMALPDKYDPRPDGTVTPVRNQEQYGTCWAHALVGSLECSLIPYDPEVDLSEWYLAYTAYLNGKGNSFEDLLENGGEYAYVSGSLISGKGLVSESLMPYGDFEVLGDIAAYNDPCGGSEYLVTEALEFPYDKDDIDYYENCSRIKEYLYNGNGLYFCYMEDNAFRDYDHASYHSPEHLSNDIEATFHAVTIVGWDDNFPKENFVEPASKDGAWLAKNSWGDWECDNGYFWISYDEVAHDLLGLSAVPAEYYDEVHSYELAGGSGYYFAEIDNPSGAMANLFTAAEDTFVTAVTFMSESDNDAYTITVYTDLTDPTLPTSGTPHSVTTGELLMKGLHTAELTEPVAIGAGETYAVVVEQSGLPNESHVYAEFNFEQCIYDAEGNLLSVDTENSFTPVPGRSFLCLDGENWVDTFDLCEEESYTETDDAGQEITVCNKITWGEAYITALTNKADTVQFSDYCDTLRIGDAIALSSYGGGEILYSVNGGEYTVYSEPIVFTEDMTISAYCEGGEVREHSYTVRDAKLYDMQLHTVYEDGSRFLESAEFVKTAENRYEADLEVFLEDMIGADVRLYTNGTVTCNGQEITAGETLHIECTLGSELVFTAVGDGMETTEYIIRFVEYDKSMTYGDLDMDGEYTAMDAAAVLTYAAAAGIGEPPALPDENWLLRADMNLNSMADAEDAATILMFAAECGAY